MTFGLKAALWYAEAGRNLERLQRAPGGGAGREDLGRRRAPSPTSTPTSRRRSAALLGLEPAPVSTQVVQRDRHAEFCAALAIVAASLEKIALEIRALQRTEILEAEEPFAEGQKGSSAMPHKRNPVLVRADLRAGPRWSGPTRWRRSRTWRCGTSATSATPRWSGSSCPTRPILLDYMLHQMTRIVEGLQVYPERMKENLERSYGLMFSQRVLLKLTDTGLPRQRAYEIVQRNAMRAWRERAAFRELLAADPEVTATLARRSSTAASTRHGTCGTWTPSTAARDCPSAAQCPPIQGDSMEQREKLYEGKAKIVYATDEPGLIIQYFKDDATAFNALKRGTIVGKGVINNRMSAVLFERCSASGECRRTSFGTLSDREMLCRRLDIIKIETIVRNVVAGSLAKRTGLEEGTAIKQPVWSSTTSPTRSATR